MKVVRTLAELRAVISQQRDGRRTVGLVPTMGFLHEGHLSLIDRARTECDLVVMSIFVNPLQFGAGEDLDRYPRDLDGDLHQAEARGVDLTFTPSVEEMYPMGTPLVTVDPGSLADVLCGRYRPGHFGGVLTVVAKLLHLVTPELAVFGRKDFQQGVLVQRMVRDFDFPVRIILSRIVREADGLAMSSRNAGLSADQRAQATGISAALRAASDAFTGGVTDISALRNLVRECLDGYPGLEVQYADFVAPLSLEEVPLARVDTVLAIAAFCGKTRLIDNCRLGPHDA